MARSAGASAPPFYAGGSVEELADCAESLDLKALYALHAGEWVPYVPGAPALENRAFGGLFPNDVPAFTPLIVTD